MKAMILAAGLGSRLKPFTDNHPKALALVNGKTLLQRNIEYLVAYGVTDIIINVHHFADQVISFLLENKQFGISITISDETSEVLETGGGLQKASWFFDANRPFLLMNVDILTNMNLQDMLTCHLSAKPLATIAVSHRESSRCFLLNEKMQLCGWRNNSTGEEKISRNESPLLPFAFSGIHIIDPKIFSFIQQKGKFSMVDVYLDLAKTHPILAYDHTGCALLDVGKPESILQAEKLFA